MELQYFCSKINSILKSNKYPLINSLITKDLLRYDSIARKRWLILRYDKIALKNVSQWIKIME